jgi:hypothetical protein
VALALERLAIVDDCCCILNKKAYSREKLLFYEAAEKLMPLLSAFIKGQF